ncbi:hypothetical protein RMCBS344292_13729 [Rhizopus microsporus]|nr:hypothetical protein RMCBS344292_13729 [Rhizopus microsporus]
MFQGSPINEQLYLPWLSTSYKLDPPYDYFDFVNTFNLEKRSANSNYANILKKALQNAKGEEKLTIAKVINMFNTRGNKESTFSIKYKEYWTKREEEDLQERIRKRQRLAAENSNDIICHSYETIIKKIAVTATTTATGIECELVSDGEETISCLENISYDAINGKFVFPDKKGNYDDDKTIIKLKEITSLPSKELTESCKILLTKLANQPASSLVMRKTIRNYGTEIAEQFDLATNYDTNFVEILSTHFPRNPLQQKQLERNAAFLTTIPILHNLFLDCNDRINMQWIEKHAPATETTKWDGIAFKVNNKLVTPLFVELSGGVEFNNGAKKAKDDEEKLLNHIVKLLKIRKAENEEIPVQYYIRPEALL